MTTSVTELNIWLGLNLFDTPEVLVNAQALGPRNYITISGLFEIIEKMGDNSWHNKIDFPSSGQVTVAFLKDGFGIQLSGFRDNLPWLVAKAAKAAIIAYEDFT